jgi:hypothetical protein
VIGPRLTCLTALNGLTFALIYVSGTAVALP